MRSAAADPEAAALMGIRLSRVAAGAWAVAGALAAIGARVLHLLPVLRRLHATGLLALSAIPVAVLGGLDSTAGALVGGLMIGVAADVGRRLPGRHRLPRPRPVGGRALRRSCSSCCCGGRRASSARGRSTRV